MLRIRIRCATTWKPCESLWQISRLAFTKLNAGSQWMPSPLLNHILLRALRLGPWAATSAAGARIRLPRFLRKEYYSPGRLNLRTQSLTLISIPHRHALVESHRHCRLADRNLHFF